MLQYSYLIGIAVCYGQLKLWVVPMRTEYEDIVERMQSGGIHVS